MQVILLERVERLGQMGDEVKVKDGFARNYLLPKKKALRATKSNREYFQTQKAQLEARNLERKAEAEAVAKKLEGKTFLLLRQAGDRGQLYGSVSPRDISDVICEGGFTVSRTQVPLDKAIKTIGLFPVSVVLHPEVRVQVTINVARTEDEGERQARGEDVLAGRTDQEDAVAAAEEMFEPGAAPQAEEAAETPEQS
ncbi:MAG: 50S ribosomal protein L9 [Alphaproteobacteria bacterium]|nr:50S ribosomal protein L9 [Alphaproteobacteria bacterium]